MSIKIGDKNKIKNSSIGHQYNFNNGSDKEPDNKKSFIEKHPIIFSVSMGIITGIIMLFSFWKDVIAWLEGFFK
ncbi:hypothetical protein CQ056_28200 [Peribacillus simplex]|uniref:hypothetical protein n=1 Tax=Peribacillus TaxID=2675229 RepID=UPI000D00592B|nr:MULTISPECIES: hypothetical protein [Peribacillus]MCF7625526.1 hypothetical protein [Peribacillus frigoritolerans]PRA73762.1 hypothetical protein CQ056_28200 [Peribacillus simplex]